MTSDTTVVSHWPPSSIYQNAEAIVQDCEFIEVSPLEEMQPLTWVSVYVCMSVLLNYKWHLKESVFLLFSKRAVRAFTILSRNEILLSTNMLMIYQRTFVLHVCVFYFRSFALIILSSLVLKNSSMDKWNFYSLFIWQL
jgi:hypothetical protein